MAKATTEPTLEPTITADMSYWQMGKHMVAGVFNTGLQVTNMTSNFAEAGNKVALATNNYADVAVTFSEDEKCKALAILKESRAKLLN